MSKLPDRERRGIVSGKNLTQVLVMSMPDIGSCVHVMDREELELSQKEENNILVVAGHSNPDLIQINDSFHTPPADLFGTEPPHTWCYYYQKASLARQQKNWSEVARLGDEAAEQDLRPNDWVEWYPFIQAYAYLGDYDKVDGIFPVLADTPYLKIQGCQLFTADQKQCQQQFPEGQQYLQEKFCQ